MFSGLALYPGGIAGTGLLLLRVSIASSLIMLSSWQPSTSIWLQAFATVVAIGLCAGTLTRVSALLGLAVPALLFAAGKSIPPIAALHSVNALALALTGPGAWSADAVFFGRRAVRLPDRN